MGQKIRSKDSSYKEGAGRAGNGLYCTVDQFHASLSESLIYLGPHAKRVHRLDDSRAKFGIAEVIRFYDVDSKPQLLAFLEEVGPNCSTLDFRSRVELVNGTHAEVHWVGSLDAVGDRINGVIVITEIAGLALVDDDNIH
jgi:hypothetical protein